MKIVYDIVRTRHGGLTMAYSMDLRQRVIDDCDSGMGTKAVAAKYRVSPVPSALPRRRALPAAKPPSRQRFTNHGGDH